MRICLFHGQTKRTRWVCVPITGSSSSNPGYERRNAIPDETGPVLRTGGSLLMLDIASCGKVPAIGNAVLMNIIRIEKSSGSQIQRISI